MLYSSPPLAKDPALPTASTGFSIPPNHRSQCRPVLQPSPRLSRCVSSRGPPRTTTEWHRPHSRPPAAATLRIRRCSVYSRRAGGVRGGEARRRHRQPHPHGRGRHQTPRRSGRRPCRSGTGREEVQEGQGQEHAHGVCGFGGQPGGEAGADATVRFCAFCCMRVGEEGTGENWGSDKEGWGKMGKCERI